ncbi:MAG: hypothetical protein CMD27_02985 [Flavobacteriales bacterium]|nr:hypothetical protein [Flavobacteriales bacterium]
MEFFIDNILYIAIVFTVFFIVFLFFKKQNSNNTVGSKKLSPNEIEIRLRAYERITLLLDRIRPLSIINRLELHKLSNSELKVVLIKNICMEYDYNISQQIYVSDDLWRLIEYIKDKMINHVAFVSDNLNSDDNAAKFIEKILIDKSQNNLLIKQAQKRLNYEVKNLS